LDELREIIPKRKNNVVSLMMNSLGKRYEKVKKLPEELGMQLALPHPVTKTSKAKCLGRKRKQIELEPETKVPAWECDKNLPEGMECSSLMR
nr:hypothetical protein [Tanacetum cinerariifolium]